MQNATVPETGRQAPEFRLRGDDGTYYTLSEWKGDKNVLLAFYPLAFSPTCAHQLPGLQRMVEAFEDADTVMLGVSVDSHWSNGAFARSLGLRFPLLSDWKREASTAYGVLIPEANLSGRALFLIDKQGRVAWSDVSADPGSLTALPDAAAALAAARALAGA